MKNNKQKSKLDQQPKEDIIEKLKQKDSNEIMDKENKEMFEADHDVASFQKHERVREKQKTVKLAELNNEIKNQKNAKRFTKYLNDKGISIIFQVIFSEIISKGIERDQVFKYCARRLRQIGLDIQMIENRSLY